MNPNAQPVNFESLNAEWHRGQDALPDHMRLRMRRALSWLERAEKETDDDDAAFIFYWIAFNAAYGRVKSSVSKRGERNLFDDYFDKVLRLDSKYIIRDAVRSNFSELIEPLLNNEFVFEPYWDDPGGLDYVDWQKLFYKRRSKVERAFDDADTMVILSNLFDRLYVLRNQIMHCAATWRGSLNRAQVRDGARTMAFLVPLFVSLMMAHPDEDWGSPSYPVTNYTPG